MLGKRGLVVLALSVVLGVGLYAVGFRSRGLPADKLPAAPAPLTDGGVCPWTVTRAELETSLTLGTEFVIAHQREAGNFDYQYNWKTKTYAKEDNDVRQAGALWALALLAQFPGPPAPPKGLRPALDKGMLFFDSHAGTTKSGARYPIYASETSNAPGGALGTAALIALATVEYARGVPPEDRSAVEAATARARSYVDFLVDARDASDLWFGKYRYDGGIAFGGHSSYSDGEALLALVKAMKYLGREELAPIVKKAAAAGHRVNIEDARTDDADSDVTKGYYQWSSMAFYELATSPWANDAPYGEWLFALADWILDIHRVLDRPRNTGYAFEGLVSAYAWAKQIGDAPRTAKYGCAIHRGLGQLLAWQVGHPRATALGKTDDPKALGGVQNHRNEPDLRIDVVQHQMHATELALRHLLVP